MKAQLIVETLKALISLGCPGFEDLKKETKIYWDDVNTSTWSAKVPGYMGAGGAGGNEGEAGGGGTAPIPKELYYYGAGGGGTTQILVKTKDGYITQEEACAKEKEKLRNLLWGKK